MPGRCFGKYGSWTLANLANAKAAGNARFAAQSVMCGEYPYSVHRMAYSCSQRYNITQPRSVCPRSKLRGRMAKKILVADDNPLIRKMLCRMFETQEDYDLCAEAENGEEAIALALKHRPDLIILDMAMPVMNGIDAAREIKQVLPGVPIILFTQYTEIATRAAFTNLPVDRVVAKNDGGSLLGHIRSLIPA